MRRRRWRLIGIGVAGLALLWLAAVAVLLVMARTAGEEGFAKLDQAQQDRSFQTLVDPATGAKLRSALSSFEESRRLLRNPLVAPLRLAPVVGRQIRAADRLDGSARASLNIAAVAVDRLREATEGPTPKGPARVQLVQDVAAITGRARVALQAIDPGSGEALIGPLDDAYRRFAGTRQESLDGLASAGELSNGLASFLAGPSHYLLLGANNAEMRAGSGMFLSATTLDAVDGRLTIGDVRPTNELVLPAGSVPVDDPDLVRNWSNLDTGRDFRNLALTPRFAVSAALAQRNWPLQPMGSPVDGVIVVDVEGLRALLKVVGPVTVDGVTYDFTNIRQELLNRQYFRFDDQGSRKDALGEVARAGFDKLEDGDWKPADLASELTLAAQGRHIMVWSSRPDDQEAWSATSVDGSLGDRSLAVSLLNRGGNKLDWFVHQRTAVDVDTRGDRSVVSVRVELANNTPSGQPRYVLGGPQAGAGVAAGEYAGVLQFDVPPTATDITVDGGLYRTIDGPDGSSRARAVYLRIPPGQTTMVTARFTLPGSHGSLVLEPTGRVPMTQWVYRGREFKAEYRRTVHW